MRRTLLPSLFAWALFALALGLALSPASLANEEQAATGRALAEAWCTSCHLVGSSGTASDAAPAFEAVANDPSKTDEHLANWLADPHPPMPNLSLGHQEIDAILAYIRSLEEG